MVSGNVIYRSAFFYFLFTVKMRRESEQEISILVITFFKRKSFDLLTDLNAEDTGRYFKTNYQEALRGF
jgi:hypothetical protein